MKRGGKREGAGRPTKLVDAKVCNLRLEERHKQVLEAIAEESGPSVTISDVVRTAIDLLDWLRKRGELNKMIARIRRVAGDPS